MGPNGTMPLEMPQHSEEARKHFRSLVPERESVVVKPMFGSVGAFVNGHMFAGLFGDRLGVKLGPADRDELGSLPGTGPFGPESRPMAGWLSLPADLPDAEAAAWFERARAHQATLPPREPKAKGSRKKA